ncbi:uncharacterized protein [Anabrus simplex]|uniref:uncharacterized protein n=1 Tax=Anabrus simplex TaxID=316456 RepID=UPI0035A28AEC
MVSPQRRSKLQLFPPYVVSMDLVKFEGLKPKYYVSENISFDYVVNDEVHHSSHNWIGLFPRGSTNLQQFLIFEWTVVCPKDVSSNRQSMTLLSKHFTPYIEFNKEYQLLFVNKKMQVVGGSTFFRFLPDEESNISESEDNLLSEEEHRILQRLENFLASQSASPTHHQEQTEGYKDFSHGDCNGISERDPDQDPGDTGTKVEVRSFELPSPLRVRCSRISGRTKNREHFEQKSPLHSSLSDNSSTEVETSHKQPQVSDFSSKKYKQIKKIKSQNISISECRSPQEKHLIATPQKRSNTTEKHRSSTPVSRHPYEPSQQLRNKSADFWVDGSNVTIQKPPQVSNDIRYTSWDYKLRCSNQLTKDCQKDIKFIETSGSPSCPSGLVTTRPSYTPPSSTNKFLKSVPYTPPKSRSKIIAIDSSFTPFTAEDLPDMSKTLKTDSSIPAGNQDTQRVSPKLNFSPGGNSCDKDAQTLKNGLIKTTSPDLFSPSNTQYHNSPFDQYKRCVDNEDTFVLPNFQTSVSFSRLPGSPMNTSLPTFASPDLPLNTTKTSAAHKSTCAQCKQPMEFSVVLEQYLAQIKSSAELNQDLRKRIAELEKEMEKSEVAQQKLKLAAEHAKQEKSAYQKFVGEMLSTISQKGFARIINAEGAELLVKRVTQAGSVKDAGDHHPVKRKLLSTPTSSQEGLISSTQSKATLDVPEGEHKENWLHMMSELTEVYHRKWKKGDDTVICDPPSSSASLGKGFHELTTSASNIIKNSSDEAVVLKQGENIECKDEKLCLQRENKPLVVENNNLVSNVSGENKNSEMEKPVTNMESEAKLQDKTVVQGSESDLDEKWIETREVSSKIIPRRESEINNKDVMNKCLSELNDIHLSPVDTEGSSFVQPTEKTVTNQSISECEHKVVENRICDEIKQHKEQQTDLIMDELSDMPENINKLSLADELSTEVLDTEVNMQHKEQQTDLCLEIRNKKQKEDVLPG